MQFIIFVKNNIDKTTFVIAVPLAVKYSPLLSAVSDFYIQRFEKHFVRIPSAIHQIVDDHLFLEQMKRIMFKIVFRITVNNLVMEKVLSLTSAIVHWFVLTGKIFIEIKRETHKLSSTVLYFVNRQFLNYECYFQYNTPLLYSIV
jgi:hypothetical protein